MTCLNSGLSNAVVMCLGYGVALAPNFNGAKLIEVFGQTKGESLLSDVIKLMDEASQIQIDWTSASLNAAGNAVRREMHSRHPYLDSKALDVIEWKFTFDWR